MGLANARQEFFSLQRSDKEKKEFVAWAKQGQDDGHKLFQETVAEHGHLIADRATGTWATQYDVIEAGGLYVHNVNKDLNMQELHELHQKIQRAKKYLSDGTIKANQGSI